jgi:CRP-like cAMP-binding protein
MIDRHLQRLRAHDEISPAEELVIRALIADRRRCRAGTTVVEAGVPVSHSTLLLDGMLARYKDLDEGQRQITQVHVPGDFPDLHGFVLKKLDQAITCLTDCEIAIVPHERLLAMTQQHPHLTRVYWFHTALDAAIHREWEVSLGRRSAQQRAAHLFCELHARLDLIGLVEDSSFALPITQADLSECLGLTSVHVNRMLRQLRSMDLVSFQSGTVTIMDLPRLKSLAEFDPKYLYLERLPRR